MAKITKTSSSTTSISAGKVTNTVTEVTSRSKTIDSNFGARAFFSIIAIVVFLLIIVNFVRYANNSSSVTFSGFLEYISHAPNMRINISISDFTIRSDWGLFNGLRNFINIFMSAFGVIVYSAVSVINMLTYFVYYVSYLFA